MSDAPTSDPNDEAGPTEFRFKQREFRVENPPTSTPSAHGPTDVREHFKAASVPNPRLVAPKPVEVKNDIHEILRENLAHAQLAGLNDVKLPRPRRSRRLRDYVIVTLVVNLIIGVVAWKFRDAPIILIFALAGFVLFNLPFSWRVWAVMDDY